MSDWITLEGTGHYFFYAFPICLLILFVLLRQRRVKFVIPCALITMIIVNPVFYKCWEDLGLYAYWRALWIVPVVPVLAAIVPSVTEKIDTISIRQPWIDGLGRTVVTVIGIVGIIFGGTFIYNTGRGQFEVLSGNSSKLPSYVIQIADRLLELKEHPRVIFQDPIGVYVRQYTGKIDSLFGRNIDGTYISTASYEAVQVNSILNNAEADLSFIKQLMLDDGYDYLVMNASRETNGLFELIETISDYGIYKAIGTPNVIKQRNTLGQIISITTVDESGNPIPNDEGYACVQYEYDENGYISREFHTDGKGTAILDDKGIAGFEWMHNSSGETTMEHTIGTDGEPVVAIKNYAELRWEYKDGHVIKESYYGVDGKPAAQEAGHVAVSQVWEGDKLLTRTYLGIDDMPINRTDGYATVDWSSEDVVFLDAVGDIVPLQGINLFWEIKTDSDGWSEWMTPTPNVNNCCFRIGMVNLGDKRIGDSYSSQIEIEFKNISSSEELPFLFCCQGSADGKWDIGNVWNYVVLLKEVPLDGVYSFSKTEEINKKMIEASNFEIAFRCDNWKSGSFRIRRVKIEKNTQPSEWTPGI